MLIHGDYNVCFFLATVPDGAGSTDSQAIASFDLLLAVIIVAVVCGLFLIGMIGFCIAFVVYR